MRRTAAAWRRLPKSVGAYAPHLANFDENVHKPKSKSYGSIGANMQLIFTYTYLINFNTSISASQLLGV